MRYARKCGAPDAQTPPRERAVVLMEVRRQFLAEDFHSKRSRQLESSLTNMDSREDMRRVRATRERNA